MFYLVIFIAVLDSSMADLGWKDSNLQGSGMSIRILRRDGGQNGGILNSDGEPKMSTVLGQHYRDYKRDGQHLRVLKRDGQHHRVSKLVGPDKQHDRVLKKDGPDGQHDKIYIRFLKRVGQQFRIIKRNGKTCFDC